MGRAEFLKIAYPGPNGEVSTRDFGGWLRIELDGLYVNLNPEDEAMLTPEEAAALSEHPTGNLKEPVLPFPFSVGQLRNVLVFAAARGYDFPLNPEVFQAIFDEKSSQLIGERMVISGRGAKTKRRGKHTRLREDELSPLIGEAQSKARSRYSTKRVWNALTPLAEQGRDPLLRVVDDGIEWEKSDGSIGLFTQKNLSDRLRREKKRQE